MQTKCPRCGSLLDLAQPLPPEIQCPDCLHPFTEAEKQAIPRHAPPPLPKVNPKPPQDIATTLQSILMVIFMLLWILGFIPLTLFALWESSPPLAKITALATYWTAGITTLILDTLTRTLRQTANLSGNNPVTTAAR
jgi:hypothetical protein